MAVDIEIADTDRTSELFERLTALERFEVKVGILGNDNSDLVMIASVHEFGARIRVTAKMRAYLHAIGLHLKGDTRYIVIPERSMLRGGFDQYEKDFVGVFKNWFMGYLEGSLSLQEFGDVIGQWWVGKIQQRITEGISPDLHPFTIERKGSSKPLIDSGRLRASFNYEVLGA